MLKHAYHHFKAALCDKDPGVMWASLHIFSDLVEVSKWTDWFRFLVFIYVDKAIKNIAQICSREIVLHTKT